MQNWLPKWLLIIFVIGLCTSSLMLKPFRLGSDLKGGTSLIYSVDMPDNPTSFQAQQILTQTIEVLQDRVNPTGVLDIFMQPLGRNRIEIVMPLPGKVVAALAKTYRDSLETLLQMAEIRSFDLTSSVEQGTAVAEFCLEETSIRCQSIKGLQSAYNLLLVAKQAYEKAQADALEGEDFNRREQAYADALDGYEIKLQEAMNFSLERSRVIRVLSLSRTQKKRFDAEGKEVIDSVTQEPVRMPSARQVSLDSIKSEFPHLTTQLDLTVQAFDEYQAERKGFDDPEDLMRLLQGAGVLEFRIAVQSSTPQGINVDEMRTQLQDVGPGNTDSNIARWFGINELKQWYDSNQELVALQADPEGFFTRNLNLVADEYEGEYYLLLYITDVKSLTHGDGRNWSIARAFNTVDNLGRAAIGFSLDTQGAGYMGRLTSPHVGQPMAIVLDGEVFSAPTLNSAIAGNGIIQGNFAQSEINYMIRVLAAGALEARLSEVPIAINTLGPSLGQDNLERGKTAFIYAIIAVAAFMLVYYFFAGLVADIALLLNGVIIFGFMAMIDGTFTLPGLAGIVLTIGMAVDANVLIYERIREELLSDEWDLRGAIREGYRKATSTIIDANVTNLIVCFVLAQTATTEVKGFAVTLSIGICATLFTALFVTRQFYYVYTDVFKAEKLNMLPIAVPAIHRALEPNINWLGMRKVFWAISLAGIVGSLLLVSSRGVDMLDTEFRGGVSIMMKTKLINAGDDAETGERLSIAHSQGAGNVLDRIRALGEDVIVDPDATGDERINQLVMREFSSASIVTVGTTTNDSTTGAVTATRFQIKIPNPKELTGEENILDVVVEAIGNEFNDVLDLLPELAFDGSDTSNYTQHTYQIRESSLGANIPGVDSAPNVSSYRGGVAVHLKNITPPTTIVDLEDRIRRMRQKTDFKDALGRDVQVVGLDRVETETGAAKYRSAVVVVMDGKNNYIRLDANLADERLAKVEWNLVNTALTKPPKMEQASLFTSAVAQTMQAKAIVAVILTLLGILVYIWIRFGSLRYSFAAIVALIHDVVIALGILALTGLIGTGSLANMLLIEEFKINLGVVAALLTIIGYSLNDTIVILDRIRENRGKLPLPTASIVNKSINQTISRTVLTSLTTLLAVSIMYVQGGSGLRPFTFCLLIGLVVGTYSSVAIAAPLVFTGKADTDPLEPDTDVSIAE
ncbi:MAG: protein translocase subunit SecD [Planctomycetota bacterium]|nr:protein translocase subunit SecD [Planctomycetota bacterium]